MDYPGRGLATRVPAPRPATPADLSPSDRNALSDLQSDLAAADIEVEAATARRRKLSERMDTLWTREAAAVGYVGRAEGEWR